MNPKGKPHSVAQQAVTENEDGVVRRCSLDDVENHLRAFVAAFVLPNAQARWLEFLIERRPDWDTKSRSPNGIKMLWKAEEVLRRFAADARYCVHVPNAQRTSPYFEAVFGAAPGVYFELGTPPCKMTAVQADRKFAKDDESALLSFQAGKRALFFCHDAGVWKCEKP